MSPADGPADDTTGDRELDRREQAARRRRRAEVFGEVLPESTRDDRDAGADRRPDDADDEWLRRNVPPHHG